MGEQSVKHKLSKKATIALILALTLAVLGGIAGGVYLLMNAERFVPEPTPEPTAVPEPEPTPEPGPVYVRGFLRCPEQSVLQQLGIELVVLHRRQEVDVTIYSYTDKPS